MRPSGAHARPRPHRPTHHVTNALLLTVLVVATAGCGARWSNAQRAEVLARNRAGSTANGSPTARAAGPATTSPAGAAAGATGGDAAVNGTDNTATANGAAQNDGGASGPLPCSAPSDAPGVTSDTITVGSISTLSGPIPGLGQSAADAARAYVSYLNSNGGVCGRKVDLKTADDGDDNGTYRSVLVNMEPNILGIVGESGAGDAGGAAVMDQKRIPAVTSAFSTDFKRASTVFAINPPYADTSQSSAKYRWLHDNGATKAALVYISVAQSVDQIKTVEQPLMEAAGIQVVSDQALPLSTLNYDSAARTVANSGANYLLFLGGYEENAGMATAMEGTGYKGLKYAEYYTTYGTNFIDQAGSAAEGATSWSVALPQEDGGANPEQAKYLQWLNQVAPGTGPDVFASSSWASTKAFFDALQQLPGPITRDALINQLTGITTYDADGLIGRINLGGKTNFGCYIGMQVSNGHWQRLVPTQGFLC